MPRTFFPRIIKMPTKGLTTRPRSLDVAPVTVDLQQTVSEWIDAETGGVYLRLIGFAPFDGYVVGASYIPDTESGTGFDTTQAEWYWRLINAYDDGEGREPITAYLRTRPSIAPLTELDFVAWDDPVPSNNIRGHWQYVLEGDMIALSAYFDDNGTGDLPADVKRPTGTVIVTIERETTGN